MATMRKLEVIWGSWWLYARKLEVVSSKIASNLLVRGVFCDWSRSKSSKYGTGPTQESFSVQYLKSFIQFYSDRYKYSDFSALKDSTTNSNASRSLGLHFVHWSDDHGLFVVVKVVNDLFSMLEELFKCVRHWAVNSSLREIQLHNYWIDNSATFK